MPERVLLVTASWDATLATTLVRHRIAIAEEAVSADLLHDLKAG